MQLQGELAKGGGQKVYKNAVDVLAKTWRNEGIRGLQRGLGPAVSLHRSFVVSSSHPASMHTRQAVSRVIPSLPLTLCQILLNGSRLGTLSIAGITCKAEN